MSSCHINTREVGWVFVPLLLPRDALMQATLFVAEKRLGEPFTHLWFPHNKFRMCILSCSILVCSNPMIAVICWCNLQQQTFASIHAGKFKQHTNHQSKCKLACQPCRLALKGTHMMSMIKIIEIMFRSIKTIKQKWLIYETIKYRTDKIVVISLA